MSATAHQATRYALTMQLAKGRDITVYPSEEKMGEDLLQRLIIELLRPLVEAWLASRGVEALTGADQFVYFRRGDTRFRVAPDLFVLPGVRPSRRVSSWKTWEHGIVPSFALEVVSLDVDKDYIDAPRLYEELGVKELILFDPDFEQGQAQARFRFQCFRSMAKRGLVRVAVTNEDRVQSKVLGCWLRTVGDGDSTRLRLATGTTGDVLVPTEAERERAAKEQERAAKEQERAAKEQEAARANRERERADTEHAARTAVEQELQRLRTELKRLKKPRR